MNESRGPLAALEFKQNNGTYRGSVPIGALALLPDDPAETMHTVTVIYQNALAEIRQWQQEFEALRRSKTALSARKAWQLGDIVHRLESGLEGYSCRIDDLYGHLSHHAGTPGWLGSFRTFRRYVDNLESIPEDLKWSSISKRSKAAGQSIASGLLLES